jgi:hypothetical protein
MGPFEDRLNAPQEPLRSLSSFLLLSALFHVIQPMS